ncbi:peroxidase mlt-7-like [Octopus sinensis]|uniref:Peroxidase mlt-7-like n=1 Tax=Octopus sinensis TaxID=2607531 RepID=A0A7E6FGV1_9MOLL|nr:peroxidase mlt-7-like [Octopus sinensis]
MRMLVALLVTGIAVILQDCLVSSSCIFTSSTTCSPITYYGINGQCNNEASKYAGSENSPLSRYLTYLATGGTGTTPYKNFFGDALPLPRKVSLDLFPCQDTTASDATHLFAIFGRLLKFDLFLTEKVTTPESCCSGASCLGIDHNGNTDQRISCGACMNYYKPVLSDNLKCTDKKQGKNQVTHVIDASFLYSSTYFTGAKSSGKFNLNSGFLPLTGTSFVGVSDDIKNPLVMALYHVFLREHNKLVDKMTEFGISNPSTEAQKLLTAIFQHITYNEYLPMLLGATTPIKSQASGTRAYDSKKLPVVSNSFSLAYELAMDSMLRETVILDPSTNPNQKLIDIMGDATKVDSDGEMTYIVKGMLTEASLKIGRKIPCSFRNHCQYSDVVSVLTQDTRYLGIPPYYVFLALTGQTSVTKFNNFPYHDTTTQNLLAGTYKYIYDVDFLSGVFLETIPSSEKLGTTLKKMIQEQFQTLQTGDRFYYENTNVFTPAQLTEIRKTSMALLLCRNVASLTSVKQHAFQMSSPDVACSGIAEIDFCDYAAVPRTWSAYQSSSTECSGFKIEFRTCTSTKPIQCPCVGDPFRLTSCPNAMVSNETAAILKLLQKKMSYNVEVLGYYKKGDMKKVEEIAKEMYLNMTQK